MAEINAYFQLIIGDGETNLKIFPSVDGGDNLEIEEVIQYLEKCSIKDYDLKEVNKTLNFSNEPKEVKVLDKEISAVDEKMKIKVSTDKKEAIIRFYPPSNGGKILSKEEILKELSIAKVIFGINERLILNHLLEPKYCYNYALASATEPIEGASAFITYHFDTDIKAKPKINEEDGTVDFHQLENINHVKVGQVLATLTPEDPGVPGTDVFGNEIRPKKVIRTILRYGKNIEVSEDLCTISSLIDGHVMLEGDRVFVNNTYEVPADINNSTGDIEYEGNILIRGTVRTGFKVRATGNIDVIGVVEAAELHSGGNIILRRGIQGMGKGMLIAKGDVVANFIENSIVVSEGNVSADSILHSRISAKGDVKVVGKNGNIIGGHTRASSMVEAKTIGTSMGTNTTIEVGIDPHIKDRLNHLNKLISGKEIELEKLNQLKKLLEFKKANGTLDRMKQDLLFKTIANIGMVKEPLEQYKIEGDELLDKLQVNKNAAVKINGEIYPGVKISISDDFIVINEIQHYCQFRKVNSEIKATPL